MIHTQNGKTITTYKKMMLENSSTTGYVPHSTQQQQKPAAATTTATTTTAQSASVPVAQLPSSSTSPSSFNANLSALNESRWLFSAEAIENSPSRRDGLTVEQEMNERQEAALFISDLAAQLKVNQLCINTAIIYMHRFFMIHSFKKFHRYVRMVATSCLFLACKVEEQPRRLKEFIEAIQRLFHRSSTDTQNPEEFRKNGEEIVALESCLLQTLGFNVLVQHAHTVIIKTCQMIKATRDLAEAAYLTATNSLILTNFCVKFSSEKIACFCIYLACKWTGLIIPTSSEGRQWYQYVKPDIVEQELEDISKEYLTIYDKCLPKIQKKLGKTKNIDASNAGGVESASSAVKRPHGSNGQPPSNNPHHKQQQYPHQQPPVKRPHNESHHPPGSSQQQQTHVNTTNQNQSNVSKQQHHHQQQQQQQSTTIKQEHQTHQHHQPQQIQHQQQRLSNSMSNLNKSLNNNNNQISHSQPLKQPTQQLQQQQPIKHSLSNQNLIHLGSQVKNEPVQANNGQAQNGSNSTVKAEKTIPTPTATPPPQQQPGGLKRGNDEISAAPNKIPKYLLDQKSAS